MVAGLFAVGEVVLDPGMPKLVHGARLAEHTTPVRVIEKFHHAPR